SPNVHIISSASGDNTARLWNLKNGQPIAIRPRQRFEAHTGRVYGVIHLPGGRRIMTCSDDGSLRVWNSQSGQKIGHDWRDGGSAVYTIALSPDGKKVVSGSADGALRLWDIDTGKVITKWSGNWFIVRCVCWSRDGGRVLSGTWDGTARVWNVESGETILAIKTGLANMEAVIYSPNETMIAAGGDSAPESKEKEFLKIWDAKTGKFIINLKGHAKLVYCLAWTTDRSTLISGSLDSSIRTWDTTTWQQIHVLTGPIVTVRAIAISPNDRILASVSIITAQLWNLENGQPIGSPLKHAHPMNCVSFSADGKLLATGSWDNDAYTWDVPAIIREAGCNELLSVSLAFLMLISLSNH
ncbi:WD40 repeat-like protein, partial [Rhizopogon vinicolor AM-OR11-026]